MDYSCRELWTTSATVVATLCYGRGIRLATVVAYALLRSWHTPCYDCGIRYRHGTRITNVTGCGQRMIQSYHRYWDDCIIAIGTTVSSLLGRLYHRYWDDCIIAIETTVSLLLRRLYHRVWHKCVITLGRTSEQLCGIVIRVKQAVNLPVPGSP
ncbi:MAG: hypothetical protein J6B92_11175 [Paraprevotella sp.]|nr:hypothetical protein [Paraprevotella sp.]